MNKETKGKGENTVKTSKVEVPVVESQQQNGDSASDDRKKALEREKLELEIEKIKVDTAKSELEKKELTKPFYKRQAYLQFSIPAVVSLLAVLASFYFGFLDRNIKEKNEEIANKEAKIKNLTDTENKLSLDKKDAEDKLNELNEQIRALQATSESEKREKENLELEKASLDEQKRQLDTQIALLNTQKEISQTQIENLKVKQAELIAGLDRLKEELIQAQIKVEIAEMKTVADQYFGNDYNTQVAGLNGIVKEYKKNPQAKENYQKFWVDIIESRKYDSNKRAYLAFILYELTGEDIWLDVWSKFWGEVIEKTINNLQNNDLNLIDVSKFYVGEINLGTSDIAAALGFESKANVKDVRLRVINKLHSKTEFLSPEQTFLFFAELHFQTSGVYYEPFNFQSILESIFEEDRELFYRLIEISILTVNNKSGLQQIRALELIRTLGGEWTVSVIGGELIKENKIEQNWSYNPLDVVSINIPKDNWNKASLNSEEWKQWLKQPQHKCLLDYWIQPGLLKLKNSPGLLKKVIEGKCD
jgi:hypothetical protein